MRHSRVVLAGLLTLVSWQRGLADEANNKHGAVSVRVVDAAGHPQANLPLELFHFQRDWYTWARVDRQVQTDGDGNATFEGLAIGNYLVVNLVTVH
jgi:hypothetical protein